MFLFSVFAGVNYVVTHFNQRINDFIQQIRMMDCQKNKKDIEVSKIIKSAFFPNVLFYKFACKTINEPVYVAHK